MQYQRSIHQQSVSKRNPKRSFLKKKRFWSILLVLPALMYFNVHPLNQTSKEVISDLPPTFTVGEMQGPELAWHSMTVKKGDSLAVLFAKHELSPKDLFSVMSLGKEVSVLKRIKPGQEIRFQKKQDQLSTLEIDLDLTQTLHITFDGQSYVSNLMQHPLETKIKTAHATIEDSLFLSGKRQDISDKTIMELTHIYGWDIDFLRDLRQGDTFKVMYEEKYKEGQKVLTGEILAAEFNNRGRTLKAFRYIHEDGRTDYYDENGQSLRKAFLKTPVEFSRISSGFSLNRRHPVLNTIRAHKGVDYAAPRGTPIKATSDGYVEFAGVKGGYGNMILLKHGSSYKTLYAHLSRYAKGVKRGARVTQGQVIGYIGSTGLATGPHLHYEFRVNGVHRNPLTYQFPKAKSIAQELLADFQEKTQPLARKLDELTQETLLASRSEDQP